MPASQDYRDGYSTAAHEVKRRLFALLEWGVTLDRKTVDTITEGVCELYGGRVEESRDSGSTS